MNYAANHPAAITRYNVSRITLYMHSAASFLSAPWAKCRAGGYNYLSEPSSDPNKNLHNPPLNGPIHVEWTTMKKVLASAMEAELGELFVKF